MFKSCLDFTPVLAWFPNSQHLAMSRVNGIEIRDALSGTLVDSFDLTPSPRRVLDPKEVSCRCLAIYPDSSRITYVTRGNRVHVWNTLARTEEFVVTGHKVGLVSINVSSVTTPPMVGPTWPRVRSTLGSDCLPALS